MRIHFGGVCKGFFYNGADYLLEEYVVGQLRPKKFVCLIIFLTRVGGGQKIIRDYGTSLY